jgi:membrane protease YdiL (CAAX protease family)
VDAPPPLPEPSSAAPPSGDAAAPPHTAQPRPSALRFFAVVLALFVVPGTLAQSASPIVGLTWSELAALLLPAVVAAVGWNLRPSAVLLLARRPTPQQAWGALGVGVAAFLVAAALANLWLAVLPERLVHRFDLSQIFDQPPLLRAGIALVAATVAPFCEEAAFRGFILSALRARHGPGAAVAICALLFALMHLDPVRFPVLVVLGAAFGWLAVRSGSLWTAVIAHGANNAVVAGLTIAGGSSSGKETADPREALAMLLPAAIILAGMVSLYRRATPDPPNAAEALAARDPADLDPRYAARRVGPGLRRAIALALAALAAIAAWGVARHR